MNISKFLFKSSKVAAFVICFTFYLSFFVNANAQNQTYLNQSDTSSPRVIATVPAEIAELPKTGVPLAVWGLAALAPLGLKLRKKGQSTEHKNSTPNTIWINRQLDK